MRRNVYEPKVDTKCHCGNLADLHLPSVNLFETGIDLCAPCVYGVHISCCKNQED